MAAFALAGTRVVIRCDAGFVATKYRIVDADTKLVIALGPITTGITTTGTLLYKATATMPSTEGDYVIQWDDGSGAWAGTEDLKIENSLATTTPGQLKPPV